MHFRVKPRRVTASDFFSTREYARSSAPSRPLSFHFPVNRARTVVAAACRRLNSAAAFPQPLQLVHYFLFYHCQSFAKRAWSISKIACVVGMSEGCVGYNPTKHARQGSVAKLPPPRSPERDIREPREPSAEDGRRATR